MVQRIYIVLEDDLDGGAAEETVQFSLDGVAYEIDLSTKNAEALRSALRDWITHARRAPRTAAAARARRSHPSRSTGATNDVRQWLRDNGHQVSDRGRIPAALQDQYDQAH